MEITNKQQAAAGYTEVDPQAYEAVLNGKPVHLYCFFRNADRSKASNSLYAGEVTVLP